MNDLNLSAKYADKVIMMEYPGRIRQVGTPSEVITEDSVKEVYGVDCSIIQDNSHPLVILGSALSDQ